MAGCYGNSPYYQLLPRKTYTLVPIATLCIVMATNDFSLFLHIVIVRGMVGLNAKYDTRTVENHKHPNRNHCDTILDHTLVFKADSLHSSTE